MKYSAYTTIDNAMSFTFFNTAKLMINARAKTNKHTSENTYLNMLIFSIFPLGMEKLLFNAAVKSNPKYAANKTAKPPATATVACGRSPDSHWATSTKAAPKNNPNPIKILDIQGSLLNNTSKYCSTHFESLEPRISFFRAFRGPFPATFLPVLLMYPRSQMFSG